jgi:hypothetical protein
MNDQMSRDLVALIIIGVVLLITSLGHTVDPQIKEWADVAFGFLFGFRSAGYVIGKDNPPSSTTTTTTSTETPKQGA